jgi:predicted AlkP superfamily pyrophosphatase or phosphodiesterase
MHPTLALLVVGLTRDLIGPHTPNLAKLASEGGARDLVTITPAVTTSVQATFLTGALPREHGIVANGWFFRELSEVLLWRQSNRLVGGDKLWARARRRDPSFTVAQLFWWYNMYADVDWAVTPRPMYPADGRKLPDVWSWPPDLRHELQGQLGQFPLFHFWGPAADIRSSDWIARSAVHVVETRSPTLTLVYLPHLDYGLQKLGPAHPDIPRHLREIDDRVGMLLELAQRRGMRAVVLSEYGITPVRDAVHINRVLRRAGLIALRDELGRDLLDPGASEAFAVADHQVAHVYVRRPERVAEVRALLEKAEGIEAVWGEEGKRERGLDHPRSGELVCLAASDRWFSYYFWDDEDRAPDYARTVDIHRKPGYDPVELFIDPAIRWPKAAVGWRLARKLLGFRGLMDVIPLDTSLVRGSHGRPTDDPSHGPVLLSDTPALLPDGGAIHATDVAELLLAHVFER